MLWVPKTTSTHGRLLEDDVLVLLGEAAADGDLHALVPPLDGREVAEVAVELVVGVLAHGAGVDDDDVGFFAVGGNVACRFERPAQPLGVVHVHLAAEGAHLVGARPAVSSTAASDGRMTVRASVMVLMMRLVYGRRRERDPTRSRAPPLGPVTRSARPKRLFLAIATLIAELTV